MVGLVKTAAKVFTAIPRFIGKTLVGGKKEEPEEETIPGQIGGAATEEELEAQRLKRERGRQAATRRPGPVGQREFGTILGGGRKFGG